MIENKSYTSIEKGNERNFGFVFSIFFLIISLYPLLKGSHVYLWPLIISIILSIFKDFIIFLLALICISFNVALAKCINEIKLKDTNIEKTK